jgi:Protein of unknown function (DUF4238)
MGKHSVPQQYLKGFGVPDEPGMIWMYNKAVRQFSKIPIKVAVQEADYFDPETEKELSESVEGPAHVVLARLRRREPISTDDRLHFAVYVATMIMRVPGRRRKSFEMMPPVLERTVEEIRTLINEWAQDPNVDQKLVARRLEEVERAHEKLSHEPPTEVINQIRSPWPNRKFVELIYGMTWRLVISDETNRFLTSDNPAYFFEAYGLGKPETEVTFPLSSDLALLASWQGPREGLIMVQAKPVLVKEVNRRVASGAERFVFYHERRDWVATLADKPRHFLSRIPW